jgi:hypothetical protein
MSNAPFDKIADLVLRDMGVLTSKGDMFPNFGGLHESNECPFLTRSQGNEEPFTLAICFTGMAMNRGRLERAMRLGDGINGSVLSGKLGYKEMGAIPAKKIGAGFGRDSLPMQSISAFAVIPAIIVVNLFGEIHPKHNLVLRSIGIDHYHGVAGATIENKSIMATIPAGPNPDEKRLLNGVSRSINQAQPGTGKLVAEGVLHGTSQGTKRDSYDLVSVPFYPVPRKN